MPLTTNSFRNAWIAIVIAMAILALPAFAQDPVAAPPAGAPAHDPAAAPATEAAPADASAPTDAAVAAPADSAEVSVTGEPPADTRALDESVQDLKKDVVDLNKELFVLEEELLFPANTQVAVFVSMDIGEFFALDSLSLKIDNKEVANYMYTARGRGAAQGRRASRLSGQPGVANTSWSRSLPASARTSVTTSAAPTSSSKASAPALGEDLAASARRSRVRDRDWEGFARC